MRNSLWIYSMFSILVIVFAKPVQPHSIQMPQILWSDRLNETPDLFWEVRGLNGKDSVSSETGETVAAIESTDSRGDVTTILETGQYTVPIYSRIDYQISLLQSLPSYQEVQNEGISNYVKFYVDSIQKPIDLDFFTILIFPTHFISNDSQTQDLIVELNEDDSIYSEQLRNLLNLSKNTSIEYNNAYFNLSGNSSRQYLRNSGILEFYSFENETHDIRITFNSPDEIDDIATNGLTLGLLIPSIFLMVIIKRWNA